MSTRTPPTALVAEAVAPHRPRLAFHSAEKLARAVAAGQLAVPVDYGAPETLRAAMAGVERVFLLDAGGPDQVERERAAVSAARTAGVRHLVKLSVWRADSEAYAIARIHRAVERAVLDSCLRYTFLRPSGFMQNFSTHMAAGIREHGAFYLPSAGARVNHIDVRDLAEVAAAALTSSAHEGQSYELSGPAALSYDEAAAILSEVRGQPVRFVAVSDEAARESLIGFGVPPSYAEALVDLHRTYRGGIGAEPSGDVERVLGRPPHSFATFARDHAAAWKG